MATGESDDGNNFDTISASGASSSIMSGTRSARSFQREGLGGGRPVVQETAIKKAELVVASSKGVKHT